MARIEPIADASLPDIRARRRPGIAIAAMIPMIATTISSSMSVKPFWLRTFIVVTPETFSAAVARVEDGRARTSRPTLREEQLGGHMGLLSKDDKSLMENDLSAETAPGSR